MTVSSRDLIRAIEAAGWREVRQKGSHRQFRHPNRPDLITVPHPKKNMSIGVIKDIENKTGLKFRRGDC